MVTDMHTAQALPTWMSDNLPDWANEGVDSLMQIWNEGAYGFTYGQIVIIVAILLFSLVIRGLFSRIVVRGIARAAAGTETQFDDAVVKAIATPLKIVPVIIGTYFALQYANVSGDAEVIADKVVQSVITLAVFWTLSRAINAFEFIFTGLRDTLSL